MKILTTTLRRTWWSSSDRTMIIDPDQQRIDAMILNLDSRVDQGQFSFTFRGYQRIVDEIVIINETIKDCRVRPEFW